MKASVFRHWPVTAPYRGEQTTRLTGGHDLYEPSFPQFIIARNITLNIMQKVGNYDKIALYIFYYTLYIYNKGEPQKCEAVAKEIQTVG